MVWLPDAQGNLQLLYQHGRVQRYLAPYASEPDLLARLARDCPQEQGTQLVVPDLKGDNTVGNLTPHLLVMARLKLGRVEGTVQVFLRFTGNATTQRGYRRYLQRACAAASTRFSGSGCDIAGPTDNSLYRQVGVEVSHPGMANQALEPARSSAHWIASADKYFGRLGSETTGSYQAESGSGEFDDSFLDRFISGLN